jgi:hypothetical protein
MIFRSKNLALILSLSIKALTALSLLGLSAVLAQATPITIPNASFESPASPAQSSTNTSLIPGWTFNVNGDGSYFGTLAISSNFNSPGASSGSDAAFINNDYPNVTDTITSAASLTTIAPLTQYTLSVAVGNVKGSDSSLYNAPGNISLSLLANGKAIATEQVSNGTVPNGTFEDFSLTYTSPASGTVIGENLTLQLAALPESGSAYKPVFDNVALDALTLDPPAVPEPATFPMVILGLLALGRVLHRRRSLTASAAAFGTLLFAASMTGVTANPITVPNASFENPTTPTGGDGAPIPGWVFNSQSGNLYGTSAINNSFRSEGAASGNNYAFMLNDVPGDTDAITSAASLGIVEPNTSYTLTVAVGNVAGSDSVSNHSPGNVSFSLLANGIAFATDTVPNGTVPDGTFEDFSLTFQTPSSGFIIGENLEIQLASLPTSGPGSGPAFDNVTLDATSIALAPEPPTWALLTAGGLSLAWLMRRTSQRVPLAVTATASKQ